MTWEDFLSLVAVAVTGGVTAAFLIKTWNLQYRPRLTVIRR